MLWLRRMLGPLLGPDRHTLGKHSGSNSLVSEAGASPVRHLQTKRPPAQQLSVRSDPQSKKATARRSSGPSVVQLLHVLSSPWAAAWSRVPPSRPAPSSH